MKNWMSVFLVLLAFGSKVVVAGSSSAGDVIYVGAALSQLSQVSDWSTPAQVEDFKCPVCLDNEPGQEVLKLNNCNHDYCQPCLEIHGRVSNCCPLCKVRMNDKIPQVTDSVTQMAIPNLAEAECPVEIDPILLYMPKAQRKNVLDRLIIECNHLISYLNSNHLESYSSGSSRLLLFDKIKNKLHSKKFKKNYLEPVYSIQERFVQMSKNVGIPGQTRGSFFISLRNEVEIFERLKSEITGESYTFEIGEVVR